MANVRLGRDIQMLLALKKRGVIRDVDWNVDGIDDWIHDLEGYLAQSRISLNTLSWHQHIQDFIA